VEDSFRESSTTCKLKMGQGLRLKFEEEVILETIGETSLLLGF
jgi:hypothetical protein